MSTNKDKQSSKTKTVKEFLKDPMLWLSLVGFIFLSSTTIIFNFNSSTMIKYAVGLIAIITFFTEYLYTRIDASRSDGEYYLNRNFANNYIYRSNIFKLFKKSHIEIYLSIIAILPIIVKLVEINYETGLFIQKNIVLNTLSDFYLFIIGLIKEYIQIIKKLWAALFLSSSIVCVSVLIEIACLSKEYFFARYAHHNEIDKESIESIREETLSNAENKIRSLFYKKRYSKANDHNQIVLINNSAKVIEKILTDGNRMCDSAEKQVYFNLVWTADNNVQLDTIKRIHELKKQQINNNLDKPNSPFEDLVLSLATYYDVKWNKLEKDYSSNSAFNIIQAAQYDLGNLVNLNERISDDSYYQHVFFHSNPAVSTNNKYTHLMTDIVDSLCQIIDTKEFSESLTEIINSRSEYHCLIMEMTYLFTTLLPLYNLANKVFEKIFRVLFAIDKTQVTANKVKTDLMENNFIKDFIESEYKKISTN